MAVFASFGGWFGDRFGLHCVDDVFGSWPWWHGVIGVAGRCVIVWFGRWNVEVLTMVVDEVTLSIVDDRAQNFLQVFSKLHHFYKPFRH